MSRIHLSQGCSVTILELNYVLIQILEYARLSLLFLGRARSCYLLDVSKAEIQLVAGSPWLSSAVRHGVSTTRRVPFVQYFLMEILSYSLRC